MYSHYLFALSSTSAACLVLGLFVSFKSIRNNLRRVFFLYSLALSIWSAGQAFAIYVDNYQISLQIVRLFHIAVIFIPVLFTHLIAIVLNVYQRHRVFIIFVYLIGTVLSLVSLTPLLVPKISYFPPHFAKQYIFEPGPFYIPMLLFWAVLVIFTFSILTRGYAVADIENKKKLRYFIVGLVISYVGGAPNFLLGFRIEIPFLMPFGTYALPLYVALTAYSIVRHKLLDIEVIVRRTVVFAGLFAFVYSAFTIVTILGKDFFRTYLNLSEWVALIPTVVIVTMTLRPLENLLTNSTEKFLFQKKYDYRELLKTFTNEVLTLLDIQQLPAQTVAGLIRILKLESASIMLYDRNHKNYSVVSQIGVREVDIVLDEKDVLIEYLKASHQPIQKDKQAERMAHGHLKETFKKLNAQICLPIPMHDELIGVMSLGMKKSGEEFTQEDIDILMTLARTEAIAISNARLFDELSKTQAEAAQREKMAVIGTLAAGINHEICNPLGIVRGQCELFLLNLRDGYYNDKSAEELLKISGDIMNKVIKETDRATSITKKLSSFAKPSRQTDLEDVYVEREVEEVLGLIAHDLKLSNIDVQRDFPANYPVIKADRKQIQEVLFNIIRNAAQAMDKKQGRIVVSGFLDNDNAIIRIADNGSGIPKDKVEQIFHPFYTTKAPGKGTGLGLFIVKQVVEKNLGTIAVESEEGIGTTFTLRFPTSAKLVAAA